MSANVEAFTSWSTTLTNNQPVSTDTADLVSDLTKIQAEVRKYVATKGADIASATTTDLATATGNYVHITGSTTVESFGTVSTGVRFILVFDGILTLTHNATSLILPGAANIITAAGDRAEVVSLGSGNWRCLWYQKESGLPAKSDNVKDYGATGNGTTDDTASIQAAVTAAMTNGTSLYIPAGTYLLTAAITGSGTKSIGLVGDGPSLTQLIWTSTASGIQLTFDDSFTAGDSVVTGIGFYADTAACVGPALQLTATTTSTLTPTFGPVITNNVVQYKKGTSATGRYWDAGFVIENFHSGLIQANFVYGRANNPAGNGLIFNGNCTPGPTISDNHFYWWNKAVTKGNSASDTVEGGFAINNTLVANNYGFYWDSTGVSGDPNFTVSGGHISSLLGGVVGIYSNQGAVHGVLFYRRSDATGDYADITYTNSVSVHIYGNTFVNSGTSGTETGIDLNNVDGILCHDNFFQGTTRAVGIDIDANCSKVSIYNNDYGGTTTPVINALTDLTLYNLKSIKAPGYASIRLTTQVIPTGTATVLSWATATLLATTDGAFTVGEPTKLTVPADVTKVKVSCSILFALNTTGYRQVRILKNGSDFQGYVNDREIATTGVGTVITASTPLLTVEPGDDFTVEVTQNSGGDLDVTASNGTWFAMEFVG